MDAKLILNVLIALFLYNLILKSIGASILKQLFKSDEFQKRKKTFKERLKEKLNEE